MNRKYHFQQFSSIKKTTQCITYITNTVVLTFLPRDSNKSLSKRKKQLNHIVALTQ